MKIIWKKLLVVLLTVSVSGLLGTPLLINLLQVVARLKVDVRALLFVEAPHGRHGHNQIGLSGINTTTGLRLSIINFCNCTIERSKPNKTSDGCFVREQNYPWIERNRTSDFYVYFLPGPEQFADGELVRISCLVAEVTYEYQILPVGKVNFMTELDEAKAVEYYQTYFYTRHMRWIQGGKLALIQLSERKFAEFRSEVEGSDRFITSTLTVTNSGRHHFSEFVFCWERSVYEMVSVVKIKHLWNYITEISIALLLASERTVAFGKRVLSLT